MTPESLGELSDTDPSLSFPDLPPSNADDTDDAVTRLRFGDYAKNLSELVEIQTGPLPDDEIVGELQEIRRGVEAAFQAASKILGASDREQALQMMQQGRA